MEKLEESLEIDPSLYSQLIFEKAAKTIKRRKDCVFNKWCWNYWTFCLKKWRKPRSYTFHKYFLRSDNRPKCKTQNSEIPRKWQEKNVDDLVFGNDSLYTPKWQSIKEKLGNLDLIKIQNLCSAEGTVKIWKDIQHMHQGIAN